MIFSLFWRRTIPPHGIGGQECEKDLFYLNPAISGTFCLRHYPAHGIAGQKVFLALLD
jgi:hypothetical protein